jgi:hypothetical protein
MRPHGSDPQKFLNEHPKLRSWIDKTGTFGEVDQDLFDNWKENLARIRMELANLEEHLAADPDSDIYTHLHNLAECCRSLNYLAHWSMTYHHLSRKPARTIRRVPRKKKGLGNLNS